MRFSDASQVLNHPTDAEHHVSVFHTVKDPQKCGLLHKPHNFPLKVVNLNYCVENDPKAPSECKETSPACCVYKMSTEAELGLSCTLTLYQFLPQYGCSESEWPLFSQINY